MTFVFDTSVLIDLEHKEVQTSKKVKELIKNSASTPVTTFLNHYEFLWGLRNRQENYRDTKSIWIQKSIILQTSKLTPVLLCSLRKKYESQGIILPLADWIVTALTIENNMTLVTKDKDFGRIEELSKIII